MITVSAMMAFAAANPELFIDIVIISVYALVVVCLLLNEIGFFGWAFSLPGRFCRGIYNMGKNLFSPAPAPGVGPELNAGPAPAGYNEPVPATEPPPYVEPVNRPVDDLEEDAAPPPGAAIAGAVVNPELANANAEANSSDLPEYTEPGLPTYEQDAHFAAMGMQVNLNLPATQLLEIPAVWGGRRGAPNAYGGAGEALSAHSYANYTPPAFGALNDDGYWDLQRGIVAAQNVQNGPQPVVEELPVYDATEEQAAAFFAAQKARAAKEEEINAIADVARQAAADAAAPKRSKLRFW